MIGCSTTKMRWWGNLCLLVTVVSLCCISRGGDALLITVGRVAFGFSTAHRSLLLRREVCARRQQHRGLVSLQDSSSSSSSSVPPPPGEASSTSRPNNDDVNNDERRRQDWLDKALQLRQEATELETKLQQEGKRQGRDDVVAANYGDSPIEYTHINDSTWAFSYRFADRPESDNDDSKQGESSTKQPNRSRVFYSGKLKALFRSDGYTDLIEHSATGSNKASVIKVWGWDIETSNDDQQDYLLFSVDVGLVPNQPKLRIYFQARQEKDKISGSLSFKGGTITIKQDIVESKSWAARLSPKGILAQFRYVGDFIVKPAAALAE